LVHARVGKTTLAHTIAASTPSIYLDLESREDRTKLVDPVLFLNSYEDRLVVLDEIHRVPELFSTLRGVIDRGRRHGHKTSRFLILGSASMELLHQSSESLAGRIACVEMGPLSVLETTATHPDASVLWTRGGFPESFLAANDRDSLEWRKDFIRSYLERDVPLLGPRVPAETLERLWTMLAHEQAALLNATRLAGSLMTSAQTVTRYIDLLVDLLLVRRLRPCHANVGKRLVKSAKVFVCAPVRARGSGCGERHQRSCVESGCGSAGRATAGLTSRRRAWRFLRACQCSGCRRNPDRRRLYRKNPGRCADHRNGRGCSYTPNSPHVVGDGILSIRRIEPAGS
jgi:predicted AAA+ superfamily ATPase